MAENTKIQWTDHTFNPWRGCEQVSPGCDNCYAEAMSHRNPAVLGEWGPDGRRVIAGESYWKEPLRWNRQAKEAGERRRVFCLSLGDVFEDWRGPMMAPQPATAMSRELYVCNGCGRWIDYLSGCVCRTTRLRQLTMEDVRARLLKLIHLTPNLDWLLLTKRPEFIREAIHKVADYASNQSATGDLRDGAELAEQWLLGSVMPNIWLGVSVEDQKRAEERIPILLSIPARVHWLSCEPLLGPLDLSDYLRAPGTPRKPPRVWPHGAVDWVVVGGESGPDSRVCKTEWVRSLVQQCQNSGAAIFVKQLGANITTRLDDGEMWPGHSGPGSPVQFSGDGFGNFSVLGLTDRKGGDPAEWPADLRVRQFPGGAE